mmetsp:Transcript_1989/g.7606  ORF Transcript_1989/g.7606 Transcript_1989/m.7606 type:complete len:367 (-) Transcript_1989:4844-5944(-)
MEIIMIQDGIAAPVLFLILGSRQQHCQNGEYVLNQVVLTRVEFEEKTFGHQAHQRLQQAVQDSHEIFPLLLAQRLGALGLEPSLDQVHVAKFFRREVHHTAARQYPRRHPGSILGLEQYMQLAGHCHHIAIAHCKPTAVVQQRTQGFGPIRSHLAVQVKPERGRRWLLREGAKKRRQDAIGPSAAAERTKKFYCGERVRVQGDQLDGGALGPAFGGVGEHSGQRADAGGFTSKRPPHCQQTTMKTRHLEDLQSLVLQVLHFPQARALQVLLDAVADSSVLGPVLAFVVKHMADELVELPLVRGEQFGHLSIQHGAQHDRLFVFAGHGLPQTPRCSQHCEHRVQAAVIDSLFQDRVGADFEEAGELS